MEILWDSIEDKEAFKKVVLEAIEHQFAKMTLKEIHEIFQDMSGKKP